MIYRGSLVMKSVGFEDLDAENGRERNVCFLFWPSGLICGAGGRGAVPLKPKNRRSGMGCLRKHMCQGEACKYHCLAAVLNECLLGD